MMETMTGRERVKRAIEHKTVDRMPIDLGAHFSTGISAFAYWNLREYLGLSCEAVEQIDCTQLLARVDDDVLDRFHVDTVLLNPPWQNPWVWNPRGLYRFLVPPAFQPQEQPDGSWRITGTNYVSRMPSGGFFFDGAWPDFYALPESEKIALFAKRAEALYKDTDRFTIWMGFPGFFGGIDFACDMLLDPDACHETQKKQLAENIRVFDAMNQACGRYIGAIELNSDLGMQSGPMCSPDSYRDIVLPYVAAFCRHVHQNSAIKVFLHSCGSVYRLLPSIVEAGVDVLNPVQISAAEMDPQRLKKEFGEKICFWGGGCDTQTMLWKASPEQIGEHVARLVQIFKPGSGYVFNQVHNIMGNVQPENIVAMYDAAYDNAF